MDFQQFKNSIEHPQPVYVLKTGEDYLNRKVLELCRTQVEESIQAFNWTVFDLAEDSVQEVVNTARTLPWMGLRRWIYVRNVPTEADELHAYLARPSEKTVLLLEVKRLAGAWKKFSRVEMASKVARPSEWIQDRVEKEGYRIERKAVRTLIELVGEDVQQLEGHLDKLFLLAIDSREIDVQSVSEMVFQTREFGIFDLIGAIASKSTGRALTILVTLLDAGMAPQQIVTMLYWNFRRLLVARELLDQKKPFRQIVRTLKIYSYQGREKEIRSTSRQELVRILISLRETDRLTKTTVADEKALLERLVVDTCRAGSV